MGHRRSQLSFETPRKRAAPQDDGGKTVIARSPCDEAIQLSKTGAPGLWIASHIGWRVAPPDGSQ
jgi:hypothetical protein